MCATQKPVSFHSWWMKKELLKHVTFVILRLLLPKILQTREGAQYCVTQTKYGTATDTLLSPAYGLPVQIS